MILLLCYYWYGFISDIAESEDWKQVDDSEAGAERLKACRSWGDMIRDRFVIFCNCLAIIESVVNTWYLILLLWIL